MTANDLLLLGVGGGAGFTPTDTANISLWLDASDASTITESLGAVSQWDDKSGLGNNATQGTGAQQPVTGTRTINGINGLDFDESATQFFSMPTIAAAGAVSIFIVFAPDEDAIIDGIIGPGANGGPGLRLTAGEEVYILKTGGGAIVLGTIVLAGGVGAVVSATTSSAGSALWIDGVADGTDGTDPGYTLGMNRVGKNGGPTLNGVLGEVVVYDRVLTTLERQAVEAYLTSKWGI